MKFWSEKLAVMTGWISLFLRVTYIVLQGLCKFNVADNGPEQMEFCFVATC